MTDTSGFVLAHAPTRRSRHRSTAIDRHGRVFALKNPPQRGHHERTVSAGESNLGRTDVDLRTGAWCLAWRLVLAARCSTPSRAGHDVYTPTLTGLGERVHLARPDIDLTTHVTDIVNLIRYEDLTDIVLVGHSSGGMVITGAVDQLPDRIAHLVYLDAFVPLSGQSVFDVAGPELEGNLKAAADKEGEGWRVPPMGRLFGLEGPSRSGLGRAEIQPPAAGHVHAGRHLCHTARRATVHAHVYPRQGPTRRWCVRHHRPAAA